MTENDIVLVEQKKRSLKKYKKNLACVARLEAKLESVEDRMTSVKSPSLSGMPRGGLPTTTVDLVAEKVELEDRLNKMKARSKKLRADILGEIDTLDDCRHAEVLEMFFIDCLPLEEIADTMGYTNRHVYRLYSEGVTALALGDH